MTNYVTYLGVKYSRPAILQAIASAQSTIVKPGAEWHDHKETVSTGDWISICRDVSIERPVLSIHEGKYFVLAGTVTEDMKRKGFIAHFVSKYNLLKTRLSITKPPPPTKRSTA